MTDQRNGIDLLEEAVWLLRRAPARVWLLHLSGALPFFAALLWYFQITTGDLRVPEPTGASLLLALLFAFRQVTRTLFAAALYEQVSRHRATRSWPAAFRAACLAVAAGFLRMTILWLPIPYLCSVFRLFGGIIWTEDSPAQAFRRAAALAGKGGSQFTGILLIALAAIMLWINCFLLLIAGPLLLSIFTGEELAITRSAPSFLSWPFVVGSLAAAWCLTDALLAAFHALQRYYGEAEETGVDILRDWRRAWARAAVATAFLLCLGFIAQAAEPARLDDSIDQVLKQPKYQWREAHGLLEDSQNPVLKALRSFVDNIGRFLRRVFRPLQHWWARFLRWLRGVDFTAPDVSGASPPVSILRLLTALGIVVLAGGVVAVLLRTRIRRRQPATPSAAVSPVPIDLENPALMATDLPEQEWLRLAAQSLEQGDTRAALRALFLGMLAHLAARRLVTVSRYKSNLDYATELARRARGLAELTGLFRGSVSRFESVWYGMYPAEPSDVQEFSAGMERIRTLCAPN